MYILVRKKILTITKKLQRRVATCKTARSDLGDTDIQGGAITLSTLNITAIFRDMKILQK